MIITVLQEDVDVSDVEKKKILKAGPRNPNYCKAFNQQWLPHNKAKYSFIYELGLSPVEKDEYAAKLMPKRMDPTLESYNYLQQQYIVEF